MMLNETYIGLRACLCVCIASAYGRRRRYWASEFEEVTGDQRKVRDEELNDLYCSPNIVRMIRSSRMGHARGTSGGKRNAYTFLLGKPEGKGLLEKPTGWVGG
jgi:hypothetical protein